MADRKLSALERAKVNVKGDSASSTTSFSPIGPAQELPVDAATAYSQAIMKIQNGIPQAGSERWLFSNGIIAEGMKINLVNFGYMSHPKVIDVEVIIPESTGPDEERFVSYKIIMPKKAVRQYLRNKRWQQWLSTKTWLGWRWLYMKTLEQAELIDVDRNVRRHVREYLGSNVPIVVDVQVG